ncbi:MAG: thiol:disulfide interchange protein, partial [Bacteroidia bacterium]
MKKTIVRLGTITLVFILSFTHVKAQDFSDAPFKTSFSKTDVKVGDVVEIILKTDIADHLHIFGVKNECDGMGSKPPEWKKLSLNDASFVGPIYHGIKADELTDDFFNCLLTQFEHKAEFRQKIKITGLNPAVSGEFWYQMCSESLCKDFNVKLKIDAKTFNISEASKGAATPVQTPDVVNPKEDPATSPDATGTENPTAADTSSETVESNPASTDSSSNNATQTEEDAERDVENKGYWGLFLLGVLGGLGAIFTPCVYPMIPMTVAFFTKEKSKVVARKKALFYGVSILGIYVVLGV